MYEITGFVESNFLSYKSSENMVAKHTVSFDTVIYVLKYTEVLTLLVVNLAVQFPKPEENDESSLDGSRIPHPLMVGVQCKRKLLNSGKP